MQLESMLHIVEEDIGTRSRRIGSVVVFGSQIGLYELKDKSAESAQVGALRRN